MHSETVFTIGHSTRSLDEFIELLEMSQIQRVADIRTIPRSRHNPQFNRDALPIPLEARKISYTHIARLGGLRRPTPASPNLGWRNLSFRGFADYMQTRDFEEGLDMLTSLASGETVALMCAEAVPWRCHRSLVSDALVIRGFRVEHIINSTSRQLHQLTPWARVEDTGITYPTQ